MKKILVLKSIKEILDWRKKINFDSRTQSIGFVPTMGALHEGHGSLLEASTKQNKISVLSIFVNPTQFNNKNDLDKYPVTWESDLAIAEKYNVDVIFLPSYDEIYPDNYNFRVQEYDFSHSLCGAFRPGHFEGVLTIVLKLLNLVQPNRAYFGEKDYQQYYLIKKMVAAYFLPIEIVACPTIRSNDQLSRGLALSSRNSRLSSSGISKAALINECISTMDDLDLIRQKLTESGFVVEYIVDYDGRRYIAAYLEGVRLIDNVKI